MQNLVPTPLPIPEFTPVPRKQRFDGWTADRQRAFIEALADTGSVQAACKRINMAARGAYFLRTAPGSESFRAAWDAALAHGVQNLADIAFERARDGVAEPVFYKGEQCGERRRYNDRLIMFLLRRYMPERFGAGAGAAAPETRSPEEIAREAARNCPVCRKRAEDRQLGRPSTPEQAKQEKQWYDELMKRYLAKVRAERWYRLSGRVVAADFTLRQLTHIELILDCGGLGLELIERTTTIEDSDMYGPIHVFASPISYRLDSFRRAVWEACGEPDRPALPFYKYVQSGAMGGSETFMERAEARFAAESRIAEAQAEWEAAAREDSWAEWKAKQAELQGARGNAGEA